MQNLFAEGDKMANSSYVDNSDYSVDGENSSPVEPDRKTYGHMMKEIGLSTRDLVRSELDLVFAESKLVLSEVKENAMRGIFFGFVAGLSAFPLIAFLVIGLGILLNDRYWLSSLIVGLVLAGVGGPLAYRSFQKITFKMPRSKAALGQELASVSKSFEDLQTTIKGEKNESH